MHHAYQGRYAALQKCTHTHDAPCMPRRRMDVTGRRRGAGPTRMRVNQQPLRSAYVRGMIVCLVVRVWKTKGSVPYNDAVAVEISKQL